MEEEKRGTTEWGKERMEEKNKEQMNGGKKGRREERKGERDKDETHLYGDHFPEAEEVVRFRLRFIERRIDTFQAKSAELLEFLRQQQIRLTKTYGTCTADIHIILKRKSTEIISMSCP